MESLFVNGNHKSWYAQQDDCSYQTLLHIKNDYTLQTLCGAQHKVCNEEGKINGLPLNRALRDEDGHIYDIVAGDFFICDVSGEDFGSLSDEQIEKYTEKFKTPEVFIKINGGIAAIPLINPSKPRDNGAR